MVDRLLTRPCLPTILISPITYTAIGTHTFLLQPNAVKSQARIRSKTRSTNVWIRLEYKETEGILGIRYYTNTFKRPRGVALGAER